MPADIEGVIARKQKREADRKNWESLWIEIENVFCPRRGTVLNQNVPGAKLGTEQYHAIGELAARELVSWLHGNLTNPAMVWFALGMRRKALNAVNRVQNFLSDTRDIFLANLNASNFVPEMGEWYWDMATIGTAVMLKFDSRLVAPGAFGGWTFRTLMPGSYTIGENADGFVDSLDYDLVMSAAAAYARWGDKLSRTMIDKAKDDKRKEEIIKIGRAIYPRKTNGDFKKVMAWADLIFDEKEKHIIAEGGFRRFPAIVGRWSKSSGEVNGRSPAMIALGEMNSLNKTREIKLIGASTDVAPVIFERQDSIVGSMLWEPFARNVVNGDPRTAVATMTSGSRFDITSLLEEDMKKIIERCFYVDQIRALPPADKPSYMTAFEVAKRYEETFRLLGPNFGQIVIPIGGLIDTGVQDLFEARVLPDIPPEIQRRDDVDIEYLGPLALAQKASDVSAIELEIGWATQVKQAVPDDPAAQQILDNYDLDWIAQHKASVRGVPARGMRGAEVVAQIRQQRAQVQQKMAEQQAMLAASQTMKDAAPMVKALQPQGAQGA